MQVLCACCPPFFMPCRFRGFSTFIPQTTINLRIFSKTISKNLFFDFYIIKSFVFLFKFIISCQKSVNKKSPFVFKTNYYNENTELLPSQTFGTAGSLDANWNVTPIQVYEQTQGTNTLPLSGLVSAVKVDNSVYLECSVTPSKSGRATLEVWCRYFPPIYTNGSGEQITETSFDYNDVIVTLNNAAPLTQRVNTHWKIVRFDVQLRNGKETPIKISSNAKGVEVAYVSLKMTD